MNAPRKLRGPAAHGATRFVKRTRSNTGVAGISEQVFRDHRGKMHRCFFVTPHYRRFNIDVLGRPEAWRRALRLRAEHEAAILPRQLAGAHTRLKEAVR